MKSLPHRLKPRQRRNVTQSKFGCFTCKDRRIKCDETKPACRKCTSTGRRCGGYPPGAPAKANATELVRVGVTSTHHLPSSVQFRCTDVDQSRDRLSHFACTVLAKGPHWAKDDFSSAYWVHGVPLMCRSLDIVRSALAAFGASMEARIPGRNSTALELSAARYVQETLSGLQREIKNPRYGNLPLMTICVLLAFADVFCDQLERALLHMKGAFALLQTKIRNTGLITDQDEKRLVSTTPIDDQTHLIFERLDLQIATFTNGQSWLPRPHLKGLSGEEFSVNDLSTIICDVQRAAYQFAAEADQFKYQMKNPQRSSLFIEQGRHLGNLEWCIHQLVKCVSGVHDEKSQDRSRAAVFGAQCRATLIYISNVLEPRETAYDRHALYFQQIITTIETLISNREEKPDVLHFSPERGMVEPLFFAAFKYRDSFWRKKAVSLLRRTGREGPWWGHVEAKIVSMVIVTEEISMASEGTPSSILESNRVCGCSRQTRNDGKGLRVVEVQMSQCIDMDLMLTGNLPYDHSSHWRYLKRRFEINDHGPNQ